MEVLATHRLGHIEFEASEVVSKFGGCLLVERIVRIWFQKEENEAVQDGVNVEDGLPVLPQNVQTHVSFQVDVGVVQGRVTLCFGGFVWISGRHSQRETVFAPFPKRFFIFEVNCDVDCVRVLLVGFASAVSRNVDL